MEPTLTYVEATAEDSGFLTQTAIASKSYWGYPPDLMKAWEPELQIGARYISGNHVVKVFEGRNFIGFFALKPPKGKSAAIDHLWIVPAQIGKGYGRLIFQHILHCLGTLGAKAATLAAEPNAKGFYDKMGGAVTGKCQSKASGRWLDVYEFKTKAGTGKSV